MHVQWKCDAFLFLSERVEEKSGSPFSMDPLLFDSGEHSSAVGKIPFTENKMLRINALVCKTWRLVLWNKGLSPQLVFGQLYVDCLSFGVLRFSKLVLPWCLRWQVAQHCPRFLTRRYPALQRAGTAQTTRRQSPAVETVNPVPFLKTFKGFLVSWFFVLFFVTLTFLYVHTSKFNSYIRQCSWIFTCYKSLCGEINVKY